MTKRDRVLWLLAITATAGALYLSGLTVWSVWVTRSQVPWRDQWTYLEDAREILAHHWGRLWYSYWGHRPVIVRLVTLANVRFFSGLNSPVVGIIFAEQAATAVLLVYAAWRLFGRLSKPVFVIVAALIVDLCFWSLQLENLVWAGQIGYILVWTSAAGAFFLLARSTGVALALGIVSTLCTPGGLFVWPVLIVEAWILRLNARVRTLMVLTGVVAVGLYLYHYQKGPPMGMGGLQSLLHPEKSIPILGMLLAGPVTAASIPAAMFLGCMALIVALYALVKMVRCQPPAMVTACGALTLFALFTIFSLVGGRVGPELVEPRIQLHQLVIPSRYYTIIGLFWAPLILVSVWLVTRNRREWPQLAVAGSMAIGLTLGTASWQIGEAANWRGYFHEVDVAGSALIMHVDDPGNRSLAEIYPDVAMRSRISAWLEKDHLALFAERRAHLLGLHVVNVDENACQGAAQSVVPVGGGAFRITGWAVPPRDLVFANASSTIVGIARSGLRRPDLAGRPDTVGWQGYAKGSGPIRVYGVLDDSGHYCRAGEFVLP